MDVGGGRILVGRLVSECSERAEDEFLLLLASSTYEESHFRVSDVEGKGRGYSGDVGENIEAQVNDGGDLTGLNQQQVVTKRVVIVDGWVVSRGIVCWDKRGDMGSPTKMFSFVEIVLTCPNNFFSFLEIKELTLSNKFLPVDDVG